MRDRGVFPAMSLLSSLPLLWSQEVPLGGIRTGFLRTVFAWLLIFGEPTMTIPGLWGALITWLKVVSLFCLLGWVAAWLSSAFKERVVARGGWLDVAALVAVIGVPVTMLLRVLETTHRLPALRLGGLS